MVSPLTYPAISYAARTSQQAAPRPSEQPAQVGRAQTEAPQEDPQSMGKMLPVTGKPEAEQNTRTGRELPRIKECQTCKNRKYQDGSDDPGVSFKTPSKIDPDMAASKVRSHEQEHVTREQAKADREGREVVSQTVILHTAICPECGRVYVSGGTTTTVTAKAEAADQRRSVQKEEGRFGGANLNMSI